MQKKGVSAVVATVLIIMITIAAVGFLFAFILPSLRDNLFGLTSKSVELNIETNEGYTIWDGVENCLDIQISRGDDDVNLTGIQVVVSNGTVSITNITNFPPEPAPSINSKRIYTFCYPISFGKPTSINVAPIVKGKVGPTVSKIGGSSGGGGFGGGVLPEGTSIGVIRDCWGEVEGTFKKICTCEDLQNIGQNSTTLGWDYSLQNNVDCSATSSWNGGKGFIPIGNCTGGCTSGDDDYPFTGVFNGNNNIISSIYINDSIKNYAALFSRVSSAEFYDINLAGVDITGFDNVGGLVGYLQDVSSIDNSGATGNVRGNNNVGGLVGLGIGGSVFNSDSEGVVAGSKNVGGLIGYASSSLTITDSSSLSLINASNSHAGGLIGTASGTNINNSYAMGRVLGVSFAGGLVGEANSNTRINNSYAMGRVLGSGSLVGGLVGKANYAFLVNSYSSGSVNGSAIAGGLVGEASDTKINNSYATGDVEGDENIGGLIGYMARNSEVDNSYATGGVTGINSLGGLIGASRGGSLIVSNSYSTGDVIGSNELGGLIGKSEYTVVIGSYWFNLTSENPGFCVGVSDDGDSCTAVQEATGISYFYSQANPPMNNSWSTDYWTFGTSFPQLAWQ